MATESAAIHHKDHRRKFRLEYNMKPEDSYRDKLEEVAQMMGVSV
jgi:hypothetical protein